MAVNKPKEIWKIGIPLSEAWHEFASQEEYNNLESLPSFEQKFKEKIPTNGLKFFEAFKEGWFAKVDEKAAIDRLKDSLLLDLSNSDLMAFGFRSSPSKSNNPVNIDPIFFDNPKVNWNDCSAEFNGKSYISIRIVDPEKLVQDKKLQIGRPSSGEIINSAIKDLILENPKFCNQPRKIACDQIRGKIGKIEIKGSGFSDVNLAKYIVKTCGSRSIK
jgi:hypothetical protein